jgi:hypothetical protein
VGRERIDLASFHVHVVVDHGTWLELRDADSDYYARPLPLPGDALLAALVREHLLALAAANTAESDLRMAEYEAERRRPTASNRVLWFVERHFIACLLATFFVVLPLVALLAAWLFGP